MTGYEESCFVNWLEIKFVINNDPCNNVVRVVIELGATNLGLAQYLINEALLVEMWLFFHWRINSNY